MYEEKNRDQDAMKLYASYQEQTGPDINVAKTLSQLYLQNEKYEKAGAKIVDADKIFSESDVILKVRAPVENEFNKMKTLFMKNYCL